MLKSPSWLVAVTWCTAPQGDLSMTASRPSVTSGYSTQSTVWHCQAKAVDGAAGRSDDPVDGSNSPYLGTRPSVQDPSNINWQVSNNCQTLNIKNFWPNEVKPTIAQNPYFLDSCIYQTQNCLCVPNYHITQSVVSEWWKITRLGGRV